MATNQVVGSGDTPPVYKIDLSLPPSQRYAELARKYCTQLQSLTSLFDELVLAVQPSISLAWVKRLARLCFRNLYTYEETEEIKGISKVTGIKVYLLVALNVLLDPLMGCTSGAALSRQPNESQTKMLHFRTLDWGMDSLRKLVVQLDFVRSPEHDKVIATSVTYVGYVGVLTGVRKGLSVSLNFRPNHVLGSAFAECRFYLSHLLVLLGIRQSISSLLRQYVLPPPEPPRSLFGRFFKRKSQNATLHYDASVDRIIATLPSIPTTAAYLIFCDGTKSLVMQKDHRSAVTSTSSSFIVATNTDLQTSSPSCETREGAHSGAGSATIMADAILDSTERRTIMEAFWDKKVNETQRTRNYERRGHQHSRLQECVSRNTPRNARASEVDTYEPNSVGRTNSLEALEPPSARDNPAEITTSLSELVEWTSTYPVTSEVTHFTAIMDPLEGKVLWVRRYLCHLRI
ncbi:hypothetical protein VTO42DRAFT_2236 [Malbranchea cinnamomea]